MVCENMKFLKSLLQDPLTRGYDIDNPETTTLRKQLIEDKAFLNRIYCEWYRQFISYLPVKGKPILEIGAGAGFIKKFIPDAITSDIMSLPDLSLIADAHALPFRDCSLQAIVMFNVFHHISNAELFLKECNRCLTHNGIIFMLEPWLTGWSKLIYTRLHHEPFDPDISEWSFPNQGPLSSANGALPWVIFNRDLELFYSKNFGLNIKDIILDMPFSYLLSGGVSMRSLMPSFMYNFVRFFEGILNQKHWAMFAYIVLEKN